MELITVAETIYKAQELYYMEKGEYSSSLSNLDITIPPSANISFYSEKSKTDVYVVAYNKKTTALRFVIYLDHHPSSAFRGRRECRVESDDAILKKVCENVTGKTVTGHSSYWIATF